jgi:hypothetical protein
MLRKYWSIWCKTLGKRISDSNKESDFACKWRTTWVTLHIITCIAIIANAVRHW